MKSSTTDQTRHWTMAAGVLLGLAVILLLHRYPGIVQDSILYMGQGLAQRAPEIFARDLFFLHGSQDQYSVLPLLLGKIFAFAKPPTVFLWGTLASLLLFAAASWFVLSSLLPERQRYWAWLGVLCLPPIYGVVRIFSYNENSLTSRPFAETLCLFCIGLMVRGHWWSASLCLLAAALFHPLQAIAALLIIWPWAVMQDRRWMHAPWLTLPILVLALLGIHPFDGLLLQADPDWLAALKESQQLFVTLWGINDFKVLGFDVFVLLLGWRILPRAFANWCAAALAGLLLGMMTSLVLVDALHLVLPAGLQLWRVHWLAHWIGMATLASLLFKHLQEKDAGRGLLLALAAQLAWGETAWGWLALMLMYLSWPLLVAGPRARMKPVLTWVFGLGLVLLFANHAANELKWFAAGGYRFDQYPIDLRLLMFPTVALGLPLLGVRAWERLGHTGRLFLLACGLLPLTLLGTKAWDARTNKNLAFEGAAFRTDIFGVTLPPTAQVFWEPESLVATWLVLHRASYYSFGQLAGQMFNRDTFADGLTREKRMLPLMQEASNCRQLARTQPDPQNCHISDESMRLACAADPAGGPDFLVLPYPQPQHAIGSWTILDPKTLQPAATYRLYRCRDVIGNGTGNTATNAPHAT